MFYQNGSRKKITNYPDKYHLSLPTEKNNTMKIGKICVTNSKCYKIFVTKIDYGLSFETHIEPLCKKPSQK